MSEFWKYFKDKLAWPQIHKPTALYVPAQGIAHTLDTVKSDMLYLRDQFFPDKCADALVPEYGKSRAITRYFRESKEDYRKRVINAYNWHLLGGKTLGLPEILRFYGFDAIRIEEIREYHKSRWAEFQVALKTPITDEEHNLIVQELETLIWLINEYKPARSVLARLYTDIWDVRPGVYDSGRYDDVNYDLFSGVSVPSLPDSGGGDVIVSFGRKHAHTAAMPVLTNLEVSHHRSRFCLAIPSDSMAYDFARYDSNIEINSGFTRSRLRAITYGAPIYKKHTWEGAWDNRKWIELISVGYERNAFIFAHRSIAVAEGAYDLSAYDALNSHYHQPIFELVDNPPRADLSAYDDHDVERRTLRIDERFEQKLLVSTEEQMASYSKARTRRTHHRTHIAGEIPNIEPNSGFFRHHKRAIIYGDPIYKDHKWEGAWDSRRWFDLFAIGLIRKGFSFGHKRQVQKIKSTTKGNNK